MCRGHGWMLNHNASCIYVYHNNNMCVGRRCLCTSGLGGVSVGMRPRVFVVCVYSEYIYTYIYRELLFVLGSVYL